MLHSLNGSWIPIGESIDIGSTTEIADCEIFYEIDRYGCMFRNDANITITQVSRVKEELFITYQVDGIIDFFPFVVDELNILNRPSGIKFGNIIQINDTFTSFCVDLIGPLGNCRLRNEFKLLDSHEMHVHYVLDSTEVRRLSIHRVYQRATLSNIKEAISFSGCNLVNNWQISKSHHGNTLRTTRIIICLDSDLTLVEYVNYKIKVYLDDRMWNLSYRFRHFFAVKQFVIDELCLHFPQIQVKLPIFPPRKVGKLSPQALEERRLGLHEYFSSLLTLIELDSCSNSIDVLSSFLQIPKYWSTSVDNGLILSVPNNRSINQIAGVLSHAFEEFPNHLISITIQNRRIKFHSIFPCLSLMELMPHVEYEICLTCRNRLDEIIIVHSLYRRYTEISGWMFEIQSALFQLYDTDVVERKLKFSTNLAIRPEKQNKVFVDSITLLPSPEKMDLDGYFVRQRMIDIEDTLQLIFYQYPETFKFPATKKFFEVNKLEKVLKDAILLQK